MERSTLRHEARQVPPAKAEPAPGDGPQGARSRGMARREFFATVVARLRESLPPELADFRHQANSMLLKVHYGNERVHFEVWPDAAHGHIEIGLHFEDGPASTVAYLAFFDARIVEIKHLLGDHVELERWTVSWGHLFETQSLSPLDRSFAHATADRLSAMIALLRPMIDEAAVPPARRDEVAVSRRRWPKRGSH